MPAVTATNMVGVGAKDVTVVTLDGSDSLTYKEARDPILVLRNPTGAPITPVIDGDGGSTEAVSGLGEVDVSGGYSAGAIAADGVKAIRLRTIAKYLQGTIAINSGSGLEASLLEF